MAANLACSKGNSAACSGPGDGLHLGALDVIRGFAVAFVFAYHCLGSAFHRYGIPWDGLTRNPGSDPAMSILYPFSLGWSGVAIFFAISGFCIHLSHLRSRGGFPVFFIRRFFRIYPPYLAALCLFAIAYPATRLKGTSPDDWWQLASHALLLHNVDKDTLVGINASFWSLAVEWQLYLIYPFLLWLKARLGWGRTLAGLAILEGAIRLALGLQLSGFTAALPTWLVQSPFAYWFSWSIGAALADAWALKQPLHLGLGWAVTAGCAAVLVDWFRPLCMMAFPLFSLSTTGLMAYALTRPQLWKQPSSVLRHLQGVGLYSYSLYLLHQPLLSLAKLPLKVWPNTHFSPWIVFGFCLSLWPVICLLSRAMFLWVEQPSIDLGKNLLRRLGARRRVPDRTSPSASPPTPAASSGEKEVA